MKVNSDQVEGQGVGLFFPSTLKPQWIDGLKARIGIFQWCFSILSPTNAIGVYLPSISTSPDTLTVIPPD